MVALNAAAQLAVLLTSRARLLAATGEAALPGLGPISVTYLCALVLAVGAASLALGLPRPTRTVFAALALLQAAFMWLLVVDLQVYALLGVHLYSPVVLDALRNPTVGRELQLGRGTTTALLLFGAGLLVLQAVLHALARRAGRAILRRAPRALPPLLAALALLFAGTGTATALLHSRLPAGAEAALDALPGYRALFGDRVPEPKWDRITYPAPGTPTPRLPRRPKILFIVVESLRADAVGDLLMPRLERFAAEYGCMRSARHYSGGHTTEFGLFSLLYGLNSYDFPPFSASGVRSWPLDVLAANGYRTAGASASELSDWNDAGFMMEQLDEYHEHTDDDSYRGDLQVLDTAREFGRAHADEPFFLMLFFNATHHNYHYPPELERFRPVIEPDYDHFMGDDALSSRKAEIANRYKNSVLFVDLLIAKALEPFAAEIARGEMVVVVTGDHGEELWEHGLLGHGASRFVEERIRVPLVLCLPGEERAPASLSSHVDVWPTILDALGADPAVEPSRYSDGASLLAPADPRLLFVGGTRFPYGNPDACLVDPQQKVWIELCPGQPMCLRPVRVTTLSDDPLPFERSDPRLRREIDQLRGLFERFVTLAK